MGPCLALLPGPAAGQAVRSARMWVEVDGRSAASVRIRYALADVAPGATIRLDLLAFDGRPPPAVQDGAGRAVAFARARGAASVGEAVAAAPGGEGEDASLELRYAMSPAAGSDGERLRLPVVSVDLPPAATGPDLFVVEVRLPPGWRTRDPFPTGLAPAPDGGGSRIARLPVVPAMVAFAAGPGGWTPDLPFLLDLVALAGLGLFAALGWRALTDP